MILYQILLLQADSVVNDYGSLSKTKKFSIIETKCRLPVLVSKIAQRN